MLRNALYICKLVRNNKIVLKINFLDKMQRGNSVMTYAGAISCLLVILDNQSKMQS